MASTVFVDKDLTTPITAAWLNDVNSVVYGHGVVPVAGVSGFNTRTGAVTLTAADVDTALTYTPAPIVSPTFTGVPQAPTAAASDSSTQIATTAFVHAAAAVSSFNTRTGAISLLASDVDAALTYTAAPTNSPTFTGLPKAPTAALGDNSTQLANTSFVQATVASATAGVSSFNARTGTVVLSTPDVVAALGYTPATTASPTFSGVPAAPTAASGTNTAQLATTQFVQAAIASMPTGVSSFNARTGTVTLAFSDVTEALGYVPATTASPTFSGIPAAPTATPGTNTAQLATTQFVQTAVTGATAGVSSFNSRTGTVTLASGDVTGALTYTPANLVSPAFAGTPTAPTATTGTNNTQIASTAFVQTAVAGSVAGVSSFNSRTGAISLTSADVTGALTYTPATLASPTFTGTPTAPTATTSTNNTQIASTAFVHATVTAAGAGVSSFNSRTGAITLASSDVTGALTYTPANLASPAFTGAPTAPTATIGTNSTQVANTAFVQATVASATAGVSSFNARTGTVVLGTADVVSALGYTPATTASPTFSGLPAAPTAAVGTNTAQLATTQFVQAAVASVPVNVSSFNSRTGAVTLTSSDVTGALTYTPANLVSPAFTGAPTVPTAAAGTNNTQIASTAFVQTTVAGAGVSSFNSRTGAVVLGTADVVSALGYAPATTASPTFSGVPAAPTATPGTNSTQLATTQFVHAAVAGVTAGVSSFNSRTGAITLASSDVTGALTYTPANLASPAFTGTPTAPTAAIGTNSTQIASTAFVQSAVAGSGTGVSSFNSRTGAISLTNADVTNALKSDFPYIDWTVTSPWATGGAATSNAITFRRNANYTGGGVDSSGNRQSGHCVSVSTVVQNGVSNCEVAVQATVESYSNLVPGAQPTTEGWPQHVASSGHAFQMNGSSAPIWGGWFVAQNKSGNAQQSGFGALTGIEVNVGITGTDTMLSSVGIVAVVQNMGSGSAKAWTAFWSGGTAGSNEWQVGFLATSATYAALQSNANGQFGVSLTGNAWDAVINVGANSVGGSPFLFGIWSQCGIWNPIGSGTHSTLNGYLKMKVDTMTMYIPCYL